MTAPLPPDTPKHIRKLKRVIEISRILTSTLDLDPLLQAIVETASELTESEASSIMLLDRMTGELRFEAAPWFQRDALRTVPVPIDHSIAGWVLRNAKPLVIADARNDPRVYRQVDLVMNFTTRSILGVPLLIKDRPIGVIESVNKLGGAAYTDEDVEILGALAAQAAISIENARLLSELQKAYSTLADLDRLKSDFIAIASHELRTPLGLILGHSTYLRETATVDSSEQLDVVLRSALRLKSIIEDLSNLEHIEQGQVRLHVTTFELDEVVTEVLNDIAALAQAKTLTLRARYSPERIVVEADREKIRVVINNLVTNAVKFTNSNGNVQIAGMAGPESVLISVSDDGIGIPAHLLEKVFDRFFQVESHLTRRFGGMGLGLSIAREMVQLHGGQIWVESVEGRGSNFSFTLPTPAQAETSGRAQLISRLAQPE